MISVLLVDDNPRFLVSIRRLLATAPSLAVVGEAISGQTALEEVGRRRPDLVLMDVEMPEMGGLEATRRIKERAGAPRVIIVSMHDPSEYREAARAAGADGFISKRELGRALFPAIAALFPTEAGVDGGREREPTAERSPGLGTRLLVVDDEPDVAAFLVDLLASDGHAVDTALNGAEALAKLEEREYALILSDVKMPELDGARLYREVAQRHPGLERRFIFMTGDAVTPATAAFIHATGVPSVAKPFTLDEVLRVVRRALRAP